MKTIELTQGKTALVDEEMYEYLTCWDWHYSNGYAKRADWDNGKSKIIRMHHIILPRKSGYVVDHINGDSLDNRRENLRLVSGAQNSVNKGLQKNSTSGYKGVNSHQGKWRAYIVKDKKQIHLGVFSDRIEAARAYNEAAMKYHGKYARLNPL